jgi:hypothetical protein
MLDLYKYCDNPELLIKSEARSLLPLIQKNNVLKWGGDISKEDLEPLLYLIKQDPDLAYAYAKNIIKGRWEEGESIIKTDVYSATHYASIILKHRWPEAEPTIMKDGFSAYVYVSSILASDNDWIKEPNHEHGRWPEAEPAIINRPDYAAEYAKFILKRRWLEAEPIIKQKVHDWVRYKNHFGIN